MTTKRTFIVNIYHNESSVSALIIRFLIFLYRFCKFSRYVFFTENRLFSLRSYFKL